MDLSVLVTKLKFDGTRVMTRSCLSSYFTSYQAVVIDEESKGEFQVVSILGPLLFSIYSNDLLEVIRNTKFVPTANYTYVTAKDKYKQSLSTLLEQLCCWFSANCL